MQSLLQGAVQCSHHRKTSSRPLPVPLLNLSPVRAVPALAARMPVHPRPHRKSKLMMLSQKSCRADRMTGLMPITVGSWWVVEGMRQGQRPRRAQKSNCRKTRNGKSVEQSYCLSGGTMVACAAYLPMQKRLPGMRFWFASRSAPSQFPSAARSRRRNSSNPSNRTSTPPTTATGQVGVASLFVSTAVIAPASVDGPRHLNGTFSSVTPRPCTSGVDPS